MRVLKLLGRLFLHLLIVLLILNSVGAFLTGNSIDGLLMLCLAYTLDNGIKLGLIMEKLGEKSEGCGCKVNKSAQCSLPPNGQV